MLLTMFIQLDVPAGFTLKSGFQLTDFSKLLLSKVRTLFAHLWLFGVYSPLVLITTSCTCAHWVCTCDNPVR